MNADFPPFPMPRKLCYIAQVLCCNETTAQEQLDGITESILSDEFQRHHFAVIKRDGLLIDVEVYRKEPDPMATLGEVDCLD